MPIRIAILGDFNPAYYTHHALNDALRQLCKSFDEELQFDWISTDTFDFKNAFTPTLYRGLFIASGSPYKDMNNVLDSLQFTRQNQIPTFGNCGGFQHMIIEFARNVCHLANADHEETNPEGGSLVIHKLACSLKGLEEQLAIRSGSLLNKIVKTQQIKGKYFCSYGINPAYLSLLEQHGLIATARSDDNQIRAVEIAPHPFYLGTLFQPALTSTQENVDPILIEFVKACMK